MTMKRGSLRTQCQIGDPAPLGAFPDPRARHPGDRDTLQALVSFSRDARDFPAALEYAEQLGRLAPNDAGLTGLIENLRRQVGKPEP